MKAHTSEAAEGLAKKVQIGAQPLSFGPMKSQFPGMCPWIQILRLNTLYLQETRLIKPGDTEDHKCRRFVQAGVAFMRGCVEDMGDEFN